MHLRVLRPAAALLACAIAIVAQTPASARAAGAPCLWPDAALEVHVAARPADAPGIWRDVCLQAPPPPVAPGSATAPRPAPAPQDVAGAEAHRRAVWQQRARSARLAAGAALAALYELQQQRLALLHNPVLRLTPAVQARSAELDAPLAQAQAQLVQAREALEVQLPRAARAAGVPPLWLLP